MTTQTQRDEIACQIEAIKALHPASSEMQIWIVDHFAEMWREIIESFEAHLGRVPSASDLLWVLGERLQADPCEVVMAAAEIKEEE